MEAAIIDFKSDPEFFYCKKQRAWLKRVRCVQFQGIAQRAAHVAGQVRGFIHPNNGYARMYSCYKCEQGREIAKRFNDSKGIAKDVKTTSKQSIPNQQNPQPKKRVSVISNHVIDWRDIMIGYNQQRGKGWRSVKQWLEYVYRSHGRICTRTASCLGVPPASLRSQMERMNIPIKGRGESGTARFLAIAAEEMSGMTKLDISRRTGLSIQTVGQLLYNHNRRYQMAGSWRGKKGCGSRG
jgi:hypothetical protein